MQEQIADAGGQDNPAPLRAKPKHTAKSAGGKKRRQTLPEALRPKIWKPGQSGNPSGMPKSYASELREARSLAQQNTVAAMQRMLELMYSPDHRVALMAAEKVLARSGLDNMNANEARQRPDLSKLPTEDLQALRRILGTLKADAAAAEAGPPPVLEARLVQDGDDAEPKGSDDANSADGTTG